MERLCRVDANKKGGTSIRKEDTQSHALTQKTESEAGCPLTLVASKLPASMIAAIPFALGLEGCRHPSNMV